MGVGTRLILIFILSFVFIFPAHAGLIDDLKQGIEIKNQEIKRLEEEAKKYRDEIVTRQHRGKTLTQELNRIAATIKNLRGDIALTTRRMQKTELEIKELSLEIREKELSIAKLQNGLAAMLQTLAEAEEQSPLEVLTRDNFLSDFFRQIDYLSFLKKKVIGSLAALKTLREELQIKKANAEEKKEELDGLRLSLNDRQKIQQNVQGERNELLRLTKNQEKLYQDILRATEQKQEAMLREIEDLEEKLRTLVDPSSLPPQRKGMLLWPLEGKVSQGYGETPFTRSRRGRHFYRFHNGIDIAVPFGTPVKAADKGKIRAVGDNDLYCPGGAYGKYIVIDHPNNLATMYAHLSLIQGNAGQEIERGDIIGYAGNSGLSTAPHLHFTLYDGRTVEIRLGSIGTCGLLPFGGSINPLLYL